MGFGGYFHTLYSGHGIPKHIIGPCTFEMFEYYLKVFLHNYNHMSINTSRMRHLSVHVYGPWI